MYNELPDDMKQQVADFLAQGDFISAKSVHDQWQRCTAVSTHTER